jgi:hypothetical protein
MDKFKQGLYFREIILYQRPFPEFASLVVEEVGRKCHKNSACYVLTSLWPLMPTHTSSHKPIKVLDA